MTEAQLLEALYAASRKTGGEGLTVPEYAAQARRSELTVRKILRAGLANGTVRRSQKTIERMDGRIAVVPAYVLLNGKKK